MAFNSFKEDEQHVERGKMQTLLRLFSYLLSYKKIIVGVLLIMGFCVFVSLVNPLIIEAAVDTYIKNFDFKGLFLLLTFALVINVISIVLVKMRMLLMAKVTNKILLTVRQDLYAHIQTLDFHFFDTRPTGKILSRIMGDINSLKSVLENCVTTLIPDFISICAVLVIMIVKSPLLALASLSSLPILAIGLWMIQVYSHKRWIIFRKKSSNLNAFIHEDISGMRVINSFTAEDETFDTFTELLEDHQGSFRNAVRINDAFGPIIDLCWGVACAAMYFVGIVVIGTDEIGVGTLIAFGSYIGMFWRPIMNLSSFYNQIITNIAAADRVFEIMDTVPEIKNKADAYKLPDIQGNVTFEDVTFAYSDAPDIKVLEHVNFQIKAGQTIALVGPTGAGKTTIVNLISRFYNATEGRVMIDGHDVQDVTIESLRKQMGIMTQDNFLFSGTIKENIRYGKLDATDEEIIQAAKAVNAHDFIMKFEKGYDTELSERGGGLSIGQRQLIAFARTFVSMPKILILDEATSSIDTQNELMVQRGIEAMLKGRTSFVIAHRLSTIQRADLIFYIDNKGIVEAGTAKELIEKKGAYYELYMAQFKV
ncbi:MAG: ABC transporter ATP-binding protein [Lachnospiraceae bacterium]|nr:ABC transporter ATP-binding protein [Lachnospiraceae bacterium]MBQ9123143.1 ABC transporter ATP-binding protein [Lachnospiraceae bacterium]